MSLVAYAGSSDDDDSSNDVEDMDTTEISTVKINATADGNVDSPELSQSFGTVKLDSTVNQKDMASIPMSSWTKFKFEELLPKPKSQSESVDSVKSNIEEVEIGPIPPKKFYGDEDKNLPPASIQNLTTKKVKGIVKISIPSLKDFDDDEEATDAKKSIQQSKKGSGLFAVLPPPKNSGVSLMVMANESGKKSTNFARKDSNLAETSSSSSVPSEASEQSPLKIVPKMPKSLVPDSVKQNLSGKRPAPTKLEEIRAKYLKKDANVRIVHSGKGPSSSTTKNTEDSDDEDSPDFFSLESSRNVVDNDPEALKKLQLPTPNFDINVPSSSVYNQQISEDMEDIAEQSRPIQEEVDVMKYVKRGKKDEAINFIDVNADDLRPDTTEWLKNMTDESAIPGRRTKGLGGAVKRKHQITYLAFEAKAREQELQNTWAQNRASRRQTQSKYGF